MEIWIWVGLIVLALVVEFSTPELVSIWFACGALVALILAAFAVPFWIQALVFVAISLVLLLSLRKILAKFLKAEDQKTNADSFVGKSFKLIQEIKDGEDGKIKINDVEWKVFSEDGKDYQVGNKVIVIKIVGNRLIIKGEQK